MNIYKFIRPLIFSIDPEIAHSMAIHFIKKSICPINGSYENEILKQNILGITFKNPIGLAAGFDKNAETGNKIFNFGFGFAEFGTVTPKPQEGNEKPRVFRDIPKQALINALGFPNVGIDEFIKNLNKITEKKAPIGINIGKNKESDGLEDYLTLLEKVPNNIDYITINISSPNTANLRNFLKPENLKIFLKEIVQKKQSLNLKQPLFIKLSPDENQEDFEKTIQIISQNNIDGIIISNTTIDKTNISPSLQNTKGGVSGRPLYEKSNKYLSLAYKQTKGKLVIVGVGGIFNAYDALEKIKLGANLVQIYTGFVYEGVNMGEKIKKDLSFLLKQEGFNNIKEAIGAKL